MSDDHAEEQAMEAEALAAIFDTHFVVTDDGQWTIAIYPEQADDPSELDQLNHVGCRLVVTLPATYPEVAPHLQIDIIKGLTPDEHGTLLQQMAMDEAQANLGVPCIFAVAEVLREWLTAHNQKGLDDQSMHAQMMRKKKQQEEALVQKEKQSAIFESQKATEDLTEAEREELAVRKRRAEGTPCNKENFEAWRDRFHKEMEALQQQLESENDTEGSRKSKKDREKQKVDKSGRLTGFEHFSGKQDNLEALEAAAEQAERDEDEEDDEEEDLEHIDEDLFDDDEDLDDLDFDDEAEEEELDI